MIRSNAGTSFGRGCQHIASGQLVGDGDGRRGGGMTITRRFGEPVASASALAIADPSLDDLDAKPPRGDDDLDGHEEEGIEFPQSTHSWLFTEEWRSLSFGFAVGIVGLSYACLILASIDIFEDSDRGNPFGVPYQVILPVRISQYLAIVISLIMEEEIPTGE